MRKNEKGKKNDSRVKTRKGSLEQKKNEKISEASWAKQMEEWKGNDRTTSESSTRSFTPSKTKNLNSSFQDAPP